MSYASGLKCLYCGADYPISKILAGCTRCNTEKFISNVTVEYDYDRIADLISRDIFESPSQSIWKFRDLLPIEKEENMITCAEGNTPLIRCRNLGGKIGLSHLYTKDESRNPTWSFKDRLSCVAVSKGLDFGAKVVLTYTTGNHGASMAAYSAKAGMDCVVFTHRYIPAIMLTFIRSYGAKVVVLPDHPPPDLIDTCIDKYGWYPTTAAITTPVTGNPYGLEGYKTIGYEVSMQLGWKSPDRMIFPTGFGEGLFGTCKGFWELNKLDLITDQPIPVAVETDAAGALTNALRKGLAYVETISTGKTVATSINEKSVTYQCFKKVKETGGMALTVTDEEIIAMQALLARTEGIYAEPASAASFVGAKRLREEGEIDRDEIVVCLNTSSGLKNPQVTEKHLPPLPVIKPSSLDLVRFLNKFYDMGLR